MQKPESLAEPIQTKDEDVSLERLKEINDAMLTYPSGFNVLKN